MGISGDIIIPATVSNKGKIYRVTSIGDHAFEWCEYITSVTIPNTVTNIENDVFIGCSRLTNVTIPNSVTKIGGWAFRD